jgi:hypothetical protein
MLHYTPATNQIDLLGDNGITWQTVTQGSAATAGNSQCSVDVSTATVAVSGNTLTWNLPITFEAGFAGEKNIYLHAVDISGINSGWQELGSTVTAIAGVPATVSVTPGSGSGARETFALQYSDSAGGASLQQVWVYFNATLANPASNACMLYYNAANNQIDLLNDNVTAWLAATPGAASTLRNSQCSVDVSAATVALSGNTLTLSLPMTFQHSYAGPKNIYLFASDIAGPNTGWHALGVWTIP